MSKLLKILLTVAVFWGAIFNFMIGVFVASFPLDMFTGLTGIAMVFTSGWGVVAFLEE